MEFEVLLNSVSKVKDFNKVASNLDCDINVISGRYFIDGKSIMGIFSLNLSTPVKVCIINTNYTESDINKIFKEFIVD